MDIHPRPQLRRERWTSLADTWAFGYSDQDISTDITVPFAPESSASGVGDPSPHPVVWYEQTFPTPPVSTAERLLLHFGAVDYLADVWVNGRWLGRHEGGHTPFTLDLTSCLPAEKLAVRVRAEDDPHGLHHPRGKQTRAAGSHDIWYTRTTGIWQQPWFEVVPDLHITSLLWSSDLEKSQLVLHAELSRKPDDGSLLEARLTLGDQIIIRASVDVAADAATIVLALPPHGIGREPLLWSPERPTLLDATLTLGHPESPIDQVESYVGLRDVEVADRRFLLNGEPYFLRFVLEQGYWPDGILTAPDQKALRREVELIKELGFNGIRLHQKIEDPRFLYWCDRLGLLVWTELPSAFAFSERTASRLLAEWADVVRRDRNHPSVVAWVLFNESWGIEGIRPGNRQDRLLQAMYALTKMLDPTRPVITNDGWEQAGSDVLTVSLCQPDQALAIMRV